MKMCLFEAIPLSIGTEHVANRPLRGTLQHFGVSEKKYSDYGFFFFPCLESKYVVH